MLITISELSSVESLCTTGSSCYPKVDHSYETFHKLKTHKAKKKSNYLRIHLTNGAQNKSR